MIFSRSTVLSRATSLRITRNRSGSSKVRVPDARRRLNLSLSSSAMRELMSASLISRMSLASICVSLLTYHELRLHSDLGGGKRHRLLSDLGRHALQLKHHSAGLHYRHPSLWRTLSLTHAGLGRLLGDRLVRGTPDPDPAATPDVPRPRATPPLEPAGRKPSSLPPLHAITAERQPPSNPTKRPP